MSFYSTVFYSSFKSVPWYRGTSCGYGITVKAFTLWPHCLSTNGECLFAIPIWESTNTRTTVGVIGELKNNSLERLKKSVNIATLLLNWKRGWWALLFFPYTAHKCTSKWKQIVFTFLLQLHWQRMLLRDWRDGLDVTHRQLDQACSRWPSIHSLCHIQHFHQGPGRGGAFTSWLCLRVGVHSELVASHSLGTPDVLVLMVETHLWTC